MNKVLLIATAITLGFCNASLADEINLGTGDYIMDLGGGDKMNLGTGDYIMGLY